MVLWQSNNDCLHRDLPLSTERLRTWGMCKAASNVAYRLPNYLNLTPDQEDMYDLLLVEKQVAERKRSSTQYSISSLSLPTRDRVVYLWKCLYIHWINGAMQDWAPYQAALRICTYSYHSQLHLLHLHMWSDSFPLLCLQGVPELVNSRLAVKGILQCADGSTIKSSYSEQSRQFRPEKVQQSRVRYEETEASKCTQEKIIKWQYISIGNPKT